MTYSFIRPHIKPLISLFTKIWVLFFAVCLGVIFSIYSFANARVVAMKGQIESKRLEAVALQEGITQNDALFDLLTQRKDLSISITGERGANEQIEKVVKNLLGFVIDSNSVRLEHLYMDSKSLKLTGITPTREIFYLLIQTPLKSIFDTSEVSFYPLKNGWLKFTNTNTIEENNER